MFSNLTILILVCVFSNPDLKKKTLYPIIYQRFFNLAEIKKNFDNIVMGYKVNNPTYDSKIYFY